MDQNDLAAWVNEAVATLSENAVMPENLQTRSDCPGLNYDKSPRHWYVPRGYTPGEMTFCQSCVDNYQLDEIIDYHGVKLGCCCDSYLRASKMGNDVFNISIWNEDSTKFRVANQNVVVMPSGRFHILVTYNKKKFASKRLFKVRAYANNVLIWSTGLVDTSIFGESVGVFINRSYDRLNVMEQRDQIYISNCELKIEIDVFTYGPRVPENYSNKDLGSFLYKDTSTVYEESSKIFYEDVVIVQHRHPLNEYAHLDGSKVINPFTKKPITFCYQLTSLPLEEDASYDTTMFNYLSRTINTTRSHYRELKTSGCSKEELEKYKTELIEMEHLISKHSHAVSVAHAQAQAQAQVQAQAQAHAQDPVDLPGTVIIPVVGTGGAAARFQTLMRQVAQLSHFIPSNLSNPSNHYYNN